MRVQLRASLGKMLSYDVSRGLPLWQILIVLAIAAVLIFGTSIGSVMCQKQASATSSGTFDHETWCFEFWLNRYQTFVAMIAAIGAAYFAWKGTQLTIEETRKTVHVGRQQLAVAALREVIEHRSTLNTLCNHLWDLDALHLKFHHKGEDWNALNAGLRTIPVETSKRQTHLSKMVHIAGILSALSNEHRSKHSEICSVLMSIRESKPLPRKLYELVDAKIVASTKFTNVLPDFEHHVKSFLADHLNPILNKVTLAGITDSCNLIKEKHEIYFDIDTIEDDVIGDEFSRLGRLIDECLNSIYDIGS